jgi:TPR repeat protein
VPVDVSRAVALLERAADAGHAKASFRLGKLNADGEIVPRNLPQAFLRYSAAAKAGVAEAQHNLGAMYASGRGVKRDYVEGLAWLIVSAKNGAEAEGEKQLRAHLLKARRPEMITAAEERTAVLLKELQMADTPVSPGDSPGAEKEKSAVAGGRPPATRSASGGPANQKLMPASTPGSGRIPLPAPGGGLSMPAMLPPPPRVEATSPVESGPAVRMISPIGRPVRWAHLSQLERAADAGQADALSDLGQVLIAGKLMPADPERAVLLLERGAAAGSPDAAYQLAEIIVAGVYHVKDDAKAFALYRQAANGGSPIAMFNVGAFLTNGKGAPRDYTEALAWIVLAKKRGVERAEVEGRIRAHLQKTAPTQIAVAETRAQVLDEEISALQKKAAAKDA